MRLAAFALVAFLASPGCAVHYAKAKLLPSTEEESLAVFREYNARLEELANQKRRAELQLKDMDELVAKMPRGETVPASFVQQREQYQRLAAAAEKELERLGPP